MVVGRGVESHVLEGTANFDVLVLAVYSGSVRNLILREVLLVDPRQAI